MERVKPQKGPGRPVIFKNGHSNRTNRLMGTRKESSKGIPVVSAKASRIPIMSSRLWDRVWEDKMVLGVVEFIEFVGFIEFIGLIIGNRYRVSRIRNWECGLRPIGAYAYAPAGRRKIGKGLRYRVEGRR
jgi:hypothetical protein